MMDLKLFFEEKDIPYTSWEIQHNEEFHIIDSEVVIEAILSTKGDERRKITDVIIALDFKNASMIDYLHFLAKSMIANNS